VNRRVLLLAGTGEAKRFAELAVDRPELTVVASLAGRTRRPAALPCPVRIGGFGGVDGLVTVLRDEAFDVVVDATHPFADQMPHQAAAACAVVGVPYVRLLRPSWLPGPTDPADAWTDEWTVVDDLDAAASALVALGAQRVLLTTGRQELAPFARADLADVHLVMRSIEAPDPQPLAHATVILDRGPFSVDGELALLAEHRIDTLVTKDSGGAATHPKLDAARQADVHVVIIRRPGSPTGAHVTTVPTPESAVAQALLP